MDFEVNKESTCTLTMCRSPVGAESDQKPESTPWKESRSVHRSENSSHPKSVKPFHDAESTPAVKITDKQKQKHSKFGSIERRNEKVKLRLRILVPDDDELPSERDVSRTCRI